MFLLRKHIHLTLGLALLSDEWLLFFRSDVKPPLPPPLPLHLWTYAVRLDIIIDYGSALVTYGNEIRVERSPVS